MFFLLGYLLINPEDFFARDDGVITMSHARNFVDHGFIGVSPSGERVLGFSAPLQFIIYTIVYFITRINPFVYTIFQTVICTFFLGYIFSKFFKDAKFGLIYSVVCAFSLTRIFTFLGWHASGMENALVHVFFIWVVYILYNFVKKNKINYYYSIVIFLATIVRFDSIYHIAPLLIIFSIYWVIRNKNIKALKFSLLVGAVWVLFMLSNYLYFGSILPHTAAEQNIDVGVNIKKILSLDFNYLKSSWVLIVNIIKKTGLLLVPVFLILTVLFDKKPIKKETRFIYIICFSLFVTGALNPLIFGMTRIDPARTVTFLSVIVMLFVCFVIKEMNFRKVIPHTIIVSILVCIAMGLYSLAFPVYYLGYSTSMFETTRNTFLSAAEENDIHRATVSNPDLGIVSWYKQFNIVDLGGLGSPLITYIKADERMILFYFDYMAPDLVEVHGHWSKRYSFLLNSDLFKQLYMPITEVSYYKDNPKQPEGIWIRKDMMISSMSNERLFYDKLKNNLSLENIEQEFKLLQESDSKNSAYISRTIYKFIPELKAQKLFNGTIDIFENYNASEFDNYLLNSSKKAAAWKPIAKLFNDYETP